MPDNTVKSVRRVFEILELFDRERKPLPAKEIAKRLGYPLTSAHALLKSIHALGYADFDASSWTYVPSPSFSSLLDWVRDFLLREQAILDFANDLNATTRETINISRRSSNRVRIIHGLESKNSVGVSVRVGTTMPVLESLTGIASVAGLSQESFAAFLENYTPKVHGQESDLDLEMIRDVHEEIRRTGSSQRCDLFVQGIGAICTPVKTDASGETLVIGIVGPSERITANVQAYRDALIKLARNHKIKTQFKLRNA